jgi:hypothetical protein
MRQYLVVVYTGDKVRFVLVAIRERIWLRTRLEHEIGAIKQ